MWTTLTLIDAATALVAATACLALSGRRLLPWRRREHAPELGPYDAAFLAGGPERVVEAALHTLWGSDNNVVIGSGRRLRLPEPWTEPEHPVEHAVVEKWRTSGSTTPTLLRVRAMQAGAVHEIGDRLVSYGLLMAPSRALARLYAARGLVVVVCSTAVLAAFAVPQGLRQAAPLIAVGTCCLALRLLCPARGPLTPAGRRRLSAIRTGELWASAALGAVVFDGRSALPGERRHFRRWGGGGGRLPSVGRMLIKYGKALDSNDDDRNPDSGDHSSYGSGSSHGSHGSSHDGGGHHHSCGGGSSCGGGNY
ncbi:TIGR04222 domain-containing membrane protein [Streptomyces sp. BE133]|uniref:TIGR04222 domain-containing membrane protein n=1 Tax=Streptomyces sp. BE133 TaxID=3002523 RepID=UPI002E7A97FB|nr:TIGR04222 domain-containing membrane protein [Streptomyces sp. BE133]MEE1808035.1 TIGR04222 domain-containing membrane protein [Streptomyces sp. BE133]